jgi:hypothetical protein
MNLIRISESDDWIVDYDRERGMYRVSYFEDNHFVDEHWFDAYEDRELSVEFPQTIGSLTYYSKADLFDLVITQQELNKKYIELNWSK